MFTVDASVVINSESPNEAGSAESRAFIDEVNQRSLTIVSPLFLLVEIASAVARATNDPEQALAFARTIRFLPVQVWVPLDNFLAEEASRVGAEHRLRGGDAVYAAVALLYKTTLVTLDRQQLERLVGVLPVRRPGEILKELS
jgi:predicted nucleic acid-binding protein